MAIVDSADNRIVRIKRGLQLFGLWDRALTEVADASFRDRLTAFQTLLFKSQPFLQGDAVVAQDEDLMRAAVRAGLIPGSVLENGDFETMTNAVQEWFNSVGPLIPQDFEPADFSGANPTQMPDFSNFAEDAIELALGAETRQKDSLVDLQNPGTTTSNISSVPAPQPTAESLTEASSSTVTNPAVGGVASPTPRAPGSDLPGVAGGAELWKVDNKIWFVVYQVPKSQPPIHMAWGVESHEAMERITGNNLEPAPDRSISSEEFNALGTLHMGITAEIQNLSEHPFAPMVAQWDEVMLTQPWMRDPEVLALTMEALIEGRDVSEAEFQSTDWWRTRTPAERAWAGLQAGDPEGARQHMLDTRNAVKAKLAQQGINDPPEQVISFFTDKWGTGAWSETTIDAQLNALADPFSNFKMRDEVRALVDSTPFEIDRTDDKEEEVRTLVKTWLGPVHGGWDEAQIARWAGRIRNDPEAADALVDMLRGQRLALFPEYSNESLTYEDIAGPWRGLVAQQWGKSMDEDDPLFSKIVRLNDSEAASEVLRREGLARGVTKVVDGATAAIGQAFGGTVRRAL